MGGMTQDRIIRAARLFNRISPVGAGCWDYGARIGYAVGGRLVGVDATKFDGFKAAVLAAREKAERALDG